MKTIHLHHHRRLGYLSTGQLRALPQPLSLEPPCARLVSFRRPAAGKPDQVIRNVHAAMRVQIPGAGSVCFHNVQSDSPLAPLLLWDAAHFLAVGEHITLVEDTPTGHYLDRAYFAEGLEPVARSASSVTYRKVARLLAEGDDDLDHWTFGIPVGPEDATILNAVVRRILELDIPHKEILLCGTPGSNFAYPDQVRLVGQDIAAPPVQICKKKNLLAREARYGNLVILHDRVFLPRHFGDMVRRFGPRYPLMTLQSLFFDNPWSLYPRRYSDLCVGMGDVAGGLQGLPRRGKSTATIVPALFGEVERTGFPYANPMRYSKDQSYPTGSLYICRKDVWNACPLDEDLHWTEFEDVEHGIRASRMGIPNRINPYGISQSITSRALLGGENLAQGIDGGFRKAGPYNLSLLKKKPLLRVATDVALARLRQFESRYTFDPAVLVTPTGLKRVPAREWVELINRVIQRTAFSNDLQAVRQFIADFERLVLFDQLPEIRREYLTQRFLEDPVQAKQNLICESGEIRNMLCQRARQSWFADDLQDFFHPRWRASPGILISALRLYFDRSRLFYFPGFGSAIKAIYNSTPFRSYGREKP
ncbi:hypothetical protein RRX38_19395 [Pseudomonas sp. DTU_2021_1001937_2_SI_NGA_ILE_001]|uniref:hypothetical protein n=1 Tax=Pseudomonas sp. DTU_2021_1001937_2_SI_NGA_ILE_001 TaxID=3077589 RepID=UPI0028FC299E|nr:hypothetical protein [Pseudomonas sp. DTU_2021_1001937_2_SI_NGA_ILE_001]WNW13229.1 hypothetical protein RRX38_19395 [Pseudomonas sp. DTU_2021_1001937_2_SI_NGA_ILE_001]